MSKKGKRLEKENEALKRQKEATAANIIRMAEERQGWKKQLDSADKKVEKLMSIIQQMQQQGRKAPPELASVMESTYSDNNQGGAEGDDESDYSNEGEDEELSEFDDDTEEEAQPVVKPTVPVTYGPERPPAPAQQQAAVTTNGH